jgi:hypothetical protein
VYDGGMSMKKTDLEKLTGKKIAGGLGSHKGGQGSALNKREQALAKKRELLEKRKPKT